LKGLLSKKLGATIGLPVFIGKKTHSICQMLRLLFQENAVDSGNFGLGGFFSPLF
jgi:hypothetical protein